MSTDSPPSHPLIQVFKEHGISSEVLEDLSKLSVEELKKITHLIDESSYSLQEWAESFLAFQAWTKAEKRQLLTQNMFEYISCCAESARAGVKLPLSFLLKEFLKTNGVE